MSWYTNLTLAQARLAALEAAELKALAGEQVKSVRYDGEALEFKDGASLHQIQAALRECRMVVQRLSGGCRTGGAIVPIFRG